MVHRDCKADGDRISLTAVRRPACGAIVESVIFGLILPALGEQNVGLLNAMIHEGFGA